VVEGVDAPTLVRVAVGTSVRLEAALVGVLVAGVTVREGHAGKRAGGALAVALLAGHTQVSAADGEVGLVMVEVRDREAGDGDAVAGVAVTGSELAFVDVLVA